VKERTLDRSLCLSQEEAFGLLEIAMMSPEELTAEQHNAIVKLTEFCRECLRDEVADLRGITPRKTDRAFPAAMYFA
jgi:hypothetical protein